MLGLASIFLFNFFLHVFCNSTKTSANSSDAGNGFYTWSHIKILFFYTLPFNNVIFTSKSFFVGSFSSMGLHVAKSSP